MTFWAIWTPPVVFGVDLGVILGSIFGSRARGAILAKTSTALRRELDS